MPPAATSKGGQKRYAQSEPGRSGGGTLRPREEKVLGAQPKSKTKKEAFSDLATLPWESLNRSQRRALQFGLRKSESMGQIGLSPMDYRRKELCAEKCGVHIADMPSDPEEVRGFYKTNLL